MTAPDHFRAILPGNLACLRAAQELLPGNPRNPNAASLLPGEVQGLARASLKFDGDGDLNGWENNAP